MNLKEILGEIAEKYPHGLPNESVIRKINLVQNELFRTTFRVRTMAIFNLQKDVFAYTLPFPQTNLIEVVVEGKEINYQDYRQKSNKPFYYFVGTKGIGLYPTPKEDVPNGLSLFYFRYPAQLSETKLDSVPELDPDFHMLLVYGALVHITESFSDAAMVNNFVGRYNGILQEFKDATNETPKGLIIEDVMGVW